MVILEQGKNLAASAQTRFYRHKFVRTSAASLRQAEFQSTFAAQIVKRVMKIRVADEILETAGSLPAEFCQLNKSSDVIVRSGNMM